MRDRRENPPRKENVVAAPAGALEWRHCRARRALERGMDAAMVSFDLHLGEPPQRFDFDIEARQRAVDGLRCYQVP